MPFDSTPPIQGPSTVICLPSIDLTQTFLQLKTSFPEKSCIESRCRTEVSFGNKPIALVTDNPSRLVQIIKKTKYTSLILFMKNQSDEMLEYILRKSIVICFTNQSLKNEEYMEFVRNLIKKRQEELGKEIAHKVKIKALMLDGIKSLPREFNVLFSISISEEVQVESIVEALEGRPEDQLEHVQSIINEMNLAPRQMIYFTIRLHYSDNDEYLKKCWKALLETFEDAGSFPRQHFLQLLHIPNVETVKTESNLDRHEVCVEIQPNNIEDYLHFLETYACGQLQTVIQNNLKINSHTFIGELETVLSSRDIKQVVKYFCPNVIKFKDHLLTELTEQNNLEELVKLIRETSSTVRQEDRVQRLTGICATQIYQTFLTSSHLSPFQYLRYLKKAGCPDFLTEIRSTEGYNALHLAVKQESDDFMKMLFYANKWGVLRKDIVKPVNVKQESLHVGYVPRRLAEALSFKDTGFKTLIQFDEYDLYWRYMPLVHRVCMMGSIPLVTSIIDIHPYHVDEKDINGVNCLFYACASGNANLVKYLLTKGVARNVYNRLRETPLHIAAMFGHLDVLNVLYSHFFEIRGKLNKDGYNALYYSVRFGDIDALKLYVHKGFKIDAKALTFAAKHQQNEIFEYIIEKVDDVNKGQDNDGRLALHYAIINGNAYAVNLLIKKKADITLMDKYDQNVLHLAAEYGQKGIMKILIDEAKQAGCLQQMISAKNIFTDMDLLIVIRGKDRGRKAWHWVELKRLYLKAFKQAMKSGQVDVVRYGLILKSGFGAYPDRECQKMMEKRLADILNERRQDMTPLHVAAIKDHPDLVEILLQNGADPNETDYKGATPMHYAAMNNNIPIMNHLCNAGASLDIHTDDDQTPLNIAEELGNSAALNFLQASVPINMTTSFCDTLLTYESMLSEERMYEMRKKGQDIRMYIIEQVRDLVIDINQVLISLGSGPVQEATDEQENRH